MKSLKFMIISFISLLVFSGGIVLLTHDFSPVTNENNSQIEDQIEDGVEETDATSFTRDCKMHAVMTWADGTSWTSGGLGNSNNNEGAWQYLSVYQDSSHYIYGYFYAHAWAGAFDVGAKLGTSLDYKFKFKHEGYYLYYITIHFHRDVINETWDVVSYSPVDGETSITGSYSWRSGIGYTTQEVRTTGSVTNHYYFYGKIQNVYPKGGWDDTWMMMYIKPKTYTIIFDKNGATGGDACSSITTQYTKSISLPKPTKTGYYFNGWYYNGSKVSWTSMPGYESLPNGSTLTLTANWVPNLYTISLNNQSATSAGTTAIYEKYNTKYYLNSAETTQMTTSANPITIPTRTGYTFGGYYTSTNGGGTQYINASGYLTSSASTTHFSSDGTLYAKWTANKYNITFDTNKPTDMSGTITQILNGTGYTDASKVISNFVTYDSTVSRTARASVTTGWIFNGYYTATSGGTKIFNADGSVVANVSGYTSSSKWVRTSGVTLYAQWTKKTTSVTFSANKPTNMSGTPSQDVGSSTFYFDTEISIKPKASVTGWTFNGYYTSATGGSQIFDANGNVKNVSGYTSSSKWANESQSITFYAHWTVNKYDITFNSNKPANMTSSIKQTLGGTDYTDASKLMSNFVTYDSTINTAKASATGWTFNGYYTAATGGSQVFDANGAAKASVSGYTSASKTWVKASGVTLYAHWTPKVLTISLDSARYASSTASTSAQTALSTGTTSVYEKYDTGYYTNSGATTQMTTSTNSISIPSMNGWTFAGYYTGKAGSGTQYIDQNGYLTSGAATNKFSANGTLYAHWTETWAQHTTEPSKVGDYYQIDTKEKLAWFMVQVNNGQTSYKAQQTANINLSAHNWYPIGRPKTGSESNNIAFAGIYDGQGYQITGLNVHGDVSGLFGYVSTGTVTNVYLSGATIFGQTKAGGIVADASGNSTISQNIVYNSTISGGTTGGIVGTATSGVTIRDCIYYNDNSVTLSGVICGSGGTVADCLSKVDGTIQRHNVNEENWQTVPSGMFGDKLPKALFWIAY